MVELVLLGDEAVALGAIHAGITASYAYPGTPATEIQEYVLGYAARHQGPVAQWCTNEKTALETALGVSFAGRRALVAMKHVGLNVAADPFVNGSIVQLNGGLVIAVADDPGMHSSQNEQDSRYYADFAHTLCLEPATQQEAYEMALEAFELSERFSVPVVLRLVTRLAHSRAGVRVREEIAAAKPVKKPADRASWILLPGNARAQWHKLLGRQGDLQAYSEACRWSPLQSADGKQAVGVITTGLARNYLMEVWDELVEKPSHLHIGCYPLPVAKIREIAGRVHRLVVLEEGYPYLERYLRGLLPPALEIVGKRSGHLPPEGELTPEIVRAAFGLPVRRGVSIAGLELPERPPQLCSGCPHGDSYEALKLALEAFPAPFVSADIGCYTLGALPPYSAIETCVCMGASIGIAKGAAEAGVHPAVAVIGDSTFLHSGITPLIDAVAARANMTLLILDNSVVAMTGGQPTQVGPEGLQKLVLGLGVDAAHFHVLDAHRRNIAHMADVLRQEMAYRGLSVVIAVRECIETAKGAKAKARAAS